MTIYTFIENYYAHNPSGHYFDHDTLKFFGERISEMKIYKDTVEKTDICGEKHICYVLSTYQHNAPSGCRRHHAYFDTTTYKEVIL